MAAIELDWEVQTNEMRLRSWRNSALLEGKSISRKATGLFCLQIGFVVLRVRPNDRHKARQTNKHKKEDTAVLKSKHNGEKGFSQTRQLDLT